MLDEINILKSFFERKSISVSTYWMECCLEWFKDNNPQYTETFMCNEVLGQWLEADLREIEHPSLPKDITKHKRHILNNNYAVQVMYVKDISRSAYSQLKQIRDMYKLTRGEVEVDNVTSGEGKRVLYLYITDGVQHINAFEYQHISCFNTDIKPGTKLLLIGPLLIRNGEILLKENNVRILGGYVENLLVCNAYENVLARELNMPENPTPGRAEPQEEQINVDNNINIDDDDDIFKNIDIPENFDQSFDINLEDIREIPQEVPQEIPRRVPQEIPRKVPQEVPQEIPRKVPQEMREPEEIPRNTATNPFVYVKDLLENRDKILNKTYKVKAEFQHCVEKLNVSKTRGWNMKFEIVDNTGTMTVDFLSSVIEKLMDLSPREAIAENKNVKNKICDSHDKVTTALKNCRKKIESFQYIMHLQFNQIDCPTIIALETVTIEHLVQLKQRVDNTEVKIF